MQLIHPGLYSRRAFLRRSAQLAFTGAALPTALNLAAMGEAAAFTAGDYKALVCVFLYGGNDYANTVVPYDATSYGQYQASRSNIALPRATVGDVPGLDRTRLVPATPLGGREYALHPNMTGLAGLFNRGRAAVQLNVGPLVEPLTREQYEAESRRQPPKLFSHNDQQSFWQSSSPEGSTVGWGGNIGDLALENNRNTLFTCISVTGNAVFLSGDSALSYQVGPGGPVEIEGLNGYLFGSNAIGQAMASIVQAQRPQHLLEDAYNGVTKRAIGAGADISDALAAHEANGDAGNEFKPLFDEAADGNYLANQLMMVARLIASRSELGPKRQVFMVSMGGFDHHSGLLGGHGELMGQLSRGMTAFYDSTVRLGVGQSVTSFTMSEFGRTLTSNGDGSDHGWGSHHLVVGGAVNGATATQGSFAGTAPPVSVGDSANAEDQWHVGQGRLLPSTSVDQYAATMARWFGVPDSDMGGILPNLHNFNSAAYPRYLNFMG